MRELRLFRRRDEYEEFVFTEVVRDPELANHPFYRNLVRFVLDAKAPIFYSQSDPSEYRNFSAYYNFVLRRDTYDDPTLESMYFLHDFAHMLFYYPHDMQSVSQAEFDDAVIQSEYAASNETEVLLHYRVPGLRERVFRDRRILFDVLSDRGVAQPSVESLYHLRRLLIETDLMDPYLFVTDADEDVRRTLKSYRGNNIWCKHRMAETHRLENPQEYFFPFLTRSNYERVLQGYESTTTQEDHERTTVRNLRLAFTLLGLSDPPATFDECFERIGDLEGQVLVRTIPTEDE